jgi:hypothetical protein
MTLERSTSIRHEAVTRRSTQKGHAALGKVDSGQLRAMAGRDDQIQSPRSPPVSCPFHGPRRRSLMMH